MGFLGEGGLQIEMLQKKCTRNKSSFFFIISLLCFIGDEGPFSTTGKFVDLLVCACLIFRWQYTLCTWQLVQESLHFYVRAECCQFFLARFHVFSFCDIFSIWSLFIESTGLVEITHTHTHKCVHDKWVIFISKQQNMQSVQESFKCMVECFTRANIMCIESL